jgi:DNA topoisomerase VI subunit B
MDGGRALGRFLGGKRRLFEKRKRIDALRKYVPETSRALARLTEKKAERIEKMFYRIIEKHYGEIDEDDAEETL